MAVRFTAQGGADPVPAPERRNLAEVIDLRTRLARDHGASVASARSAHSAAPRGSADRGTRAPVALISIDGPSSENGQPTQNTEDAVAADGVRLLARRAWSSDELRRELVALGHDAHEVDAAILQFESSIYLDDLGLARVLIEKLRLRKRLSRAQLRVKLRERLLPDGVIEEALGELDAGEDLALLRDAAADRARRLGGLERRAAERRLLGFLARRGWTGEQAMAAVREALDAVERQ